MGKSLIKFDTNHIKDFVFGTDRLKEIRGASSLLDKFNRKKMRDLAKEYCDGEKIKYKVIYLFAGTGLFLLMADEKAVSGFGKYVQQEYYKETCASSSMTYAVCELPPTLSDNIEELMISEDKHISDALEMLHYRIREAKGKPPESLPIALTSHPFVHTCDSCGINYAEHRVAEQRDSDPDNDDDSGIYCSICRQKQLEDGKVKGRITDFHKEVQILRTSENAEKLVIDEKYSNDQNLWARTFYYLNNEEYDFKFLSEKKRNFPKRPKDFNIFREFTTGKDYIGLIYADGNNMQIRLNNLRTLRAYKEVSQAIDHSIHAAVSKAIHKHLAPVKAKNDKSGSYSFPFDILLLGGDDIVIVTDASKAIEVAQTIAKEFYDLTEKSDVIHSSDFIKDPTKDTACTLSIGVALAPIKYPFNHLRHMAEDALKGAKKESLKIRKQPKGKARDNGGQVSRVNDSCINFIVVTGGSIKNFDEVEKNVYRSKIGTNDFHATLRPYSLEGLDRLLKAIKEGQKRNLGRTKLHALREAVLQKNLTSSVSDGLAVLRNWNEDQRKFVMTSLYEAYAGTIPEKNSKDPVNDFPRVTFPWFIKPDKSENKPQKEYYTTFLDFVELYDFVTREDGNV